jgi:ubiquinone/menaquinone biosynthesis C-methylase UbiE
MKTRPESWIDFWKSEETTSEAMSRLNMEIFLQSTEPIMHYNYEDVVLDIGCGLGYFPALMKGKVREIHCLDISDKYLDICRKRFDQYENVHFYKLAAENYTDLSVVKTKRFSKIICLSVIQYYRDISEVETLIEGIREIAFPGARLLIADIPKDTNPYLDILSIIKTGLKAKCGLEAFRHLIKLRVSDYCHVRSQAGFLIFSERILNHLSRKHELDAQIFTYRMTINRGRLHWLIRF